MDHSMCHSKIDQDSLIIFGNLHEAKYEFENKEITLDESDSIVKFAEVAQRKAAAIRRPS